MLMRIGTYLAEIVTRPNRWIHTQNAMPEHGKLVEFFCADGRVRPGIGQGQEPPFVVFLPEELHKLTDNRDSVGPLMWRYKREEA